MGWNGLFSSKEAFSDFEKRCQQHRMNDVANDIAPQTLKIIEELMYLNGCVKRGRGSDIDADSPGKNIFEYIKELEKTIKFMKEGESLGKNIFEYIKELEKTIKFMKEGESLEKLELRNEVTRLKALI